MSTFLPDLQGSGAFPVVQARQFTPPRPGEAIVCEGRNYWLGNFIANGAFGAVFECTDDWSNHLVAKILSPKGLPYDHIREQWLREMSNLLALRHPYITFIHDAFEYRDTFYLIIERCSEQLSDLIQWKDLLPEHWIHPIAQCVLQALSYIHSMGYVHKDVHPGNVFVSHTRGVMASPNPATVFKIGDLGISRLAPDIDVFNTILAKWMLPPEAIDPRAFGQIGPQVDIYHAGLTFLSLMTKEIPTFNEEAILAGVPRQVAEGLSSPYGAAISRALRRHVDQRTPSALQFWREISDVTYGLRQAAG